MIDRYKGNEILKRALYNYIIDRIVDIIVHGTGAKPIQVAHVMEGS
jgi:hypothetical protein